MQRSLDAIYKEKRDKLSWDWSVNNIDRPVIDDERNLRSFIQSARQINELNTNNPHYINEYLDKLKHSCEVIIIFIIIYIYKLFKRNRF